MKLRLRHYPEILLLALVVAFAAHYLFRLHLSSEAEKAPYHKELDRVISKAIEQSRKLKFTDFNLPEWDCICVHEQYHTVATSLENCLKNNSDSNLGKFNIYPFDFTAKENNSGLILINFSRKEAAVYLSPYNFNLDIRPCYKLDNPSSMQHTTDAGIVTFNLD